MVVVVVFAPELPANAAAVLLLSLLLPPPLPSAGIIPVALKVRVSELGEGGAAIIARMRCWTVRAEDSEPMVVLSAPSLPAGMPGCHRWNPLPVPGPGVAPASSASGVATSAGCQGGGPPRPLCSGNEPGARARCSMLSRGGRSTCSADDALRSLHACGSWTQHGLNKSSLDCLYAAITVSTFMRACRAHAKTPQRASVPIRF